MSGLLSAAFRFLERLPETRLFTDIARWRWWRVVVLVAFASALGLFNALLGLDDLLKRIHLAGAGSFGVADLLGVGFHLPDAGRATEGVRTWVEYDRATAGLHRTDGPTIARWWLSLDLVFAALLATLLGVVLLKLGAGLRRISESAELIGNAALRRRSRPGFPSDRESFPQTRNRLSGLLRVYSVIVATALVIVPVYFAADALENITTWLLIDDLAGAGSPASRSAWVYPAYVFASLKWLTLALIAIAAAIGLRALIFFSRPAIRSRVNALMIVRAQAILLLFFSVILLFDPSGQVADAIRRWVDDPVDGVLGGGIVLWLSLLGFAVTWHLLGSAATERWKPPWVRMLLITAVVTAAAAGVLSTWGWGVGLLGLVIILLIAALLSTPIVGARPEPLPDVLPFRLAFAPPFAAVPLVVLGVAVFRAALPEVAYSSGPAGDYAALLGAAAGLQLAGWTLYGLLHAWARRRSPLDHSRLRRPTELFVVASLVGAAVVTGLVWSDRWAIGDAFGSIGILAAFLVGTTLVFWALVYVAERATPPNVFLVLRLRRLPVFTLLLAWLLLASSLDKTGAYHDVRLQTTAPIGHDFSAGQAFGAWKQIATKRLSARKAIPMVFVAASGGGVRAAYWTDLVLACVFEGRMPCEWTPPRPEVVFAGSGASGGSLGLATYAAHKVAGDNDPHWVENALGGDVMAPTLAWALFVDGPLAFVRRTGGDDRAAVLEKGWQRAWQEHGKALETGLFSLRRRRDVPFLIFNGTKVRDGCRFSTSSLDLAVEPQVSEGDPASEAEKAPPIIEDCLALRPFERGSGAYTPADRRAPWTLSAAEDLGDYLCPRQDVRLSTAALLSGRFPFVSPSGRIARCREGEAPRERNADAINVVDGGYFDASASRTVVELWGALADEIRKANAAPGSPCIVPLYLQIDNEYSEVATKSLSRAKEISAPLVTFLTGKDSRESQARQEAALIFSRPLEAQRKWPVVADGLVDRYAHIYPRAHPGTTAPLGWVLSKASRNDLIRQLAAPENVAELDKIRNWFDQDLHCSSVRPGA